MRDKETASASIAHFTWITGNGVSDHCLAVRMGNSPYQRTLSQDEIPFEPTSSSNIPPRSKRAEWVLNRAAEFGIGFTELCFDQYRHAPSISTTPISRREIVKDGQPTNERFFVAINLFQLHGEEPPTFFPGIQKIDP
jgi:hypothetical protein